MISLLLLVFLVHLAIYIINTIGASTVDNLLWLLYLRLPTTLLQDSRKHQELKRDVVQFKREMNATSSQDEFAKWAKLRRRHDKALDEYEAMNRSIGAQKTSFEWKVKTARWISTNGFKIFLQFYYSKTPIFDLPPGWFPYPVEWILSFPRAPLGTVSIQVWGSVCATVIPLSGDIVTSVVQKIVPPQAIPAGGKSEAPKKEL
ncbi:protein get1 [Talaromyces proteolyticus]|uniref:Protein get1 n=1 Tax=Talaromyces proteolyticus TaxID=1131652 RepID=A0AAD4KRD0_9EURO|nr:protein get1 [Talaromyces proteolyticus]KAH8697258.1 protein get1 [Talaromyces proteolyticus]